ncbi:EsV-1-7 [Ectocarpus siliculosus]|uniref:EsV-1-7 n=1 Tax=Ectocarpus siliculosus TaxID=2880 RepID=D7FI73_ECTSI|nr:EsV-1-7 [Ectocarpus siliculosus]|eukprot:CBJ28698.1 EsV-1-7 [Ectocarpus siliculosus]
MSQCGHANCTKRPTYGVAGSKKREFCSQHARDGMVNVNNKRCIQPNCTTIPSFAAAGSKKAEFCSQHAREGMVDVRSRRCSQRGCNTQPSLGEAGSSKIPGACKAHASEGMVGLRSKRCARRGCTLRPSYVSGQGNETAEFCGKHANDEILAAGMFGEYGDAGATPAAAAAAAGAKRKQPPPIAPYELGMGRMVPPGLSAGMAARSDIPNKRTAVLPVAAAAAASVPPPLMMPPPFSAAPQQQQQQQPNDTRYVKNESLEFRPLSAPSNDRYLGAAESLAHFRASPSERYMNNLGGGGGEMQQFRPQQLSPNDRYGAAGLMPVGAESSAYSEEIAAVFDREMPL